MKVALVHDWLIHMRGGEKVLDALAELYPEATLYTLFYDRKKISPNLARLTIKASFLQYLPGIKSYYRWLLPILPWVIRSMKVEDADLVISSSHCVAKGIRVPERAYHVCYCYTPMRYLWGFQDVYFDRYLAPVRILIRAVFHFLKKWDLKTNERVDLFVTSSEYIRKRIKDAYQREAMVVHPPLETGFFRLGHCEEPRQGDAWISLISTLKSSAVLANHFKKEGKCAAIPPIENRIATPPLEARDDKKREAALLPHSDYYLAVSHFVPYKRLDIVIEAFNSLDRDLVIIGSGPLSDHYHKLRKSGRISFSGAVNDQELLRAYQGAKAFIFPAEEDFGIVPLEAQACGAPVIAFGKGGSLETVKSGVFFDEQTPEAIREAVLRFEGERFDREEVARKVQGFGREHFLNNMKKTIDNHFTQKVKVS